MIPYSELWKQPGRVDLNQSPLPAPLNIYVEPGNRCNYKCDCCPESLSDFAEQQGGWHKLSWADWESVAGKIEEFGVPMKSLHFYMLGEPLLNPFTTDFIADAKARNLAEKTILTTNGVLVKKYAENLVSCGLDYLRVSIYEQYRKDWEKIASGLYMLKKLRGTREKPFIYVKAFRPVPAIAMFPKVADEVVFENQHNWNGDEKLGPTFHGDKNACPLPFYTLVVHSDLKVSVCCVDWNKQLLVGDLKKQTLKDVWTGTALHNIRVMHLAKDGRKKLPGCKDCTLLYSLQDSIESLSPMEYNRRVWGTPLHG